MGRHTSKRPAEARDRGSRERSPAGAGEDSIRDWLRYVRFKKVAFGGVSEADVWKKIGELNALYEQALAAERVRYDALLQERAGQLARELYARMGQSGPQWEGGHGSYE